jgi:hypothetical protein
MLALMDSLLATAPGGSPFVCDSDILTVVVAIDATLQDLSPGTLGTDAGVAAAAKELAKG